MPQTIQIPGVGEVEFPDSMDDSQIELAAGRLASEAIQRPQSYVSTTQGGSRVSLPDSRVALGSVLEGLKSTQEGFNEPLQLPEPSERYVQENPLLGSFLQRGSRVLGGFAAPSSIASLPLFAIPYAGPALALGLGAKGLGSAFGEISTGRPENVGGGLAEGLVPALMTHVGAKQARRPIFEATPEGRLAAELTREPDFGRTADPQAQRRLGTILNPNALAEPSLTGLMAQIMQERQPGQNLQVPGKERALDVLSEMVQPTGPRVVPGGEPTALKEGVQGGKVSFSAEAPTLLRNVPQTEKPLSEQERLMQQSFVPAPGTAAFEAQKGEPNAPRVRSNKGRLPEERVPAEGSEEARGENLQQQQTGEERPSVSGKEGGKVGEEGQAVQPSGTQSVAEQAPEVPGIKIPEPKGPPGEAGGFVLPGPELIRTVSGFKKNAVVAGQQLYNRLRNILHPDEFKAYEDSGLRVFLSRPRSPDDVAKWMEENGPRVEEKVFGAGGEGADPRRREAVELQHQLETRGYQVNLGQGTISVHGGEEVGVDRYAKLAPEQDRAAVSRLAELVDEIDFRTGEGLKGLDPDQYRSISSKDAPQKMVVVRVPSNLPPEVTSGRISMLVLPSKKAGVLHKGQHLGTEDVNVLGWARGHDDVVGGKKVWSTDEVQDDLIDKDSSGKYYFTGDWKSLPGDKTAFQAAAMRPSGQAKFDSFNEANAALAKAWPLTKDRQRLTLKSLISQAIKEGKDAVVLPDAETAMMSEGHDVAATNHPEGWNYQEPEQAGGMKLNYDKILPKIMEELTGVKGTPVDLGPHQNAYTDLIRREGLVIGQGEPKPRTNLIFRNPDGTPKTSATGLLFDLSKVKEKGEPFKLFGSDKMTEGKQGGIRIPEPGTKGGEAGAFVLPPVFQKVVEALTPKKGSQLTDTEVEYGTKGPVIMFRSYDTEKKIATSPQGIGRIPGLAQVFDPRASAKDAVMQAILTGQSMTFKGKQISTLFLEATKTLPRAFMEDKNGMTTLANGTKAPTSDVIRREIANPGSQPLTPDQQQFITMWRTLRKGLVDYARSEGVKKVVDDQGTTVNLSKYSFPTSSYYDPASGKVLREPDAFVRVSKFMEAIYSAIAAERISKDPALQGRKASSGPATLKEGGSFVPWARGRIFPKEIADEINRYYGAQPHSFARQLTSANDFLKAFKYTMDVSAPFNQGLLMMTRFPLRWAHATLRSYAAMADPNQFSKYLQPRMEDAKEFVTHGGSLGSLQDFLIGAQKGSLATRVPVLGHVVKRSAESMNTFLSIGKLEMYRALKQSVPTKDLPRLVEAIENTILSGRMEAIGLTPARNLAERLLFNAPSYLRGAANLVASIPQAGIQGRIARQSLGTLAGALSVTMFALYKMAGMSDDEIKDRFDPGNSKFLRYPTKLANGDVLEEGAGNVVIQMVRLLGNTVDVAKGQKPGGSGVEGNPILRWLSYRGSPLVQLAAQIYTGKDYLWRDISAKEAAARSVLPISAEQFWSREKMGTKAVESGLQFFGLSSYPENFSATRERLQKETADQMFRKAYEGLNPRERAKVAETIKPTLDVKREETGPPSLEFIEKMDKIRQQRITGTLSDEQRTFLERNKLKLPGYRLQSTVRGTEISYTKKEEELYEGFLVEEYKKAVDRLRENLDFDGLSQKSKEVRFGRVTERARERAKLLLQREIRAVH